MNKAVNYFLNNTSLRQCKKRDYLVRSIQDSRQQMRQAKRLVQKHPKKLKLIDYYRFHSDVLKLQAKRGVFNPIFGRMVSAAEIAVYNGHWTEEEHLNMMKILSDSRVPWCKDDIKRQRAVAERMLLDPKDSPAPMISE